MGWREPACAYDAWCFKGPHPVPALKVEAWRPRGIAEYRAGKTIIDGHEVTLRENPEGAARYSIVPPDGLIIGRGIRVRWNPNAGVMVGELHYSADLMKCTVEWYRKERAANKARWDREYELAWKVADGKAVYHDTFDHDNHVAMEPLVYDPSLPIYTGWDFGRDPCCCFLQVTPQGRVFDIGEVRAPDKMSITSFLPYWQSYVSRRFFADGSMPVFRHAGDPSAWDPGQQGEQTCKDILAANGIHMWKPWTNQLAARLGAVEELLSGMVGGKPRYQIDAVECTFGIEGFIGGYVYKKIPGTELWSDMPEKNEFSHIADARQYACMLISRVLKGRENPPRRKPRNWRKDFKSSARRKVMKRTR